MRPGINPATQAALLESQGPHRVTGRCGGHLGAPLVWGSYPSGPAWMEPSWRGLRAGQGSLKFCRTGDRRDQNSVDMWDQGPVDTA